MDVVEKLVRITRGEVRKWFWLSLGAFVAGEAVVGFFAFQLDGFPKDVELARTLVSAVLCAAVTLAGLELIEHRWFPRYGRAAARIGVFTLPLLASFIWLPGSGAWSDLHWSLALVLVGVLAVSAQRIWLGDWTGKGRGVRRALFAATAASIAVSTPLGVAAIWGWHSAEVGRWIGSSAFLGVVGLLLTPVARRASRKRSLMEQVS
jgi:hypothetical protein